MTNNKKAVIFSDGKIKRFEKIVNQQTDEKKSELNRSLDNKVDDIFEKKYTIYLKEIKDKKYEKKNVSTKEASDFLKNFSKEK